jgi:hypothetical protein
VLSLVVGIAVIVIGATLLVDGAVDAARAFSVSDAVIGLTIIAIGTSAPELVTTILSTIRGDRDIALATCWDRASTTSRSFSASLSWWRQASRCLTRCSRVTCC